MIDLFWYYHSFVVELVRIFHYHTVHIEDYVEYRSHVNLPSNTSEIVAKLAWDSSLWRILIYSNRSLDSSRQKIISRGKDAGKLPPPRVRAPAGYTISNKGTPYFTLMQEVITPTDAVPEGDDYYSDDDVQEELDTEDRGMEGEEHLDSVRGLRCPAFSNGELAQSIKL